MAAEVLCDKDKDKDGSEQRPDSKWKSSPDGAQADTENVIYEAFVLLREIVWCFFLLPSWRKGAILES